MRENRKERVARGLQLQSLDLLRDPVSTRCDHQFCRMCMLKHLSGSKRAGAQCPLCKAEVTKRSLQDSSRFKQLVEALQRTIHAFEQDTGTKFFTSPRILISAPETKRCEELWEEKGAPQSPVGRNRAKRATASKASKRPEGEGQPAASRGQDVSGTSKNRAQGSLLPLQLDFSEVLLEQKNGLGAPDLGLTEAQAIGTKTRAESSACERLGGRITDSESQQELEAAISSAAAEGFAKLMDLDDSSYFANSGTAVAGSSEPTTQDRERSAADVTDPVIPVRLHMGNNRDLTSSREEEEHSFVSASKDVKDSEHLASRKKNYLSSNDQDPSGENKTFDVSEKSKTNNKDNSLQSAENLKASDFAQVSSNKILEKRRKTSVQKVMDWLSRIDEKACFPEEENRPAETPSDADSLLEEVKSNESDGDSSATEKCDELVQECVESLKKTDRRSTLEDQVFGVVYKRARRTSAQLNKSFSSDRKGVEVFSSSSSKEHQANKKVCKRKSNELTPADFIKRPSPVAETSDATSQPARSDAGGRVRSESLHVLVSDGNQPEIEQRPSPSQRTARAETTQAGGSWKDEEEDLQPDRQERKGKKSKPNTKDNRKRNALTRKKAIKAAKPLDLVSCQQNNTGQDADSAGPWKPTINETEAQIESYPSSEEPAGRAGEPHATRRSRRLQLLTEKVRCTGRRLRTEDSELERDPQAPDQSENGQCLLTSDQAGMLTCKGVEQLCESSEKENETTEVLKVSEGYEDIQQQSGHIVVESSLVSIIRNAESPCNSNKAFKGDQLVPSALDISEGPDTGSDVAVMDELLPGELTEGKNDSELETEQILKTFKISKRRSFNLLPSPEYPSQESEFCDNKASEKNENPEEEKGQVNVAVERTSLQSEKELDSSCVKEPAETPGTNLEQPEKPETLRNEQYSASRHVETENSGCTDIIPPTKPASPRPVSFDSCRNVDIKSGQTLFADVSEADKISDGSTSTFSSICTDSQRPRDRNGRRKKTKMDESTLGSVRGRKKNLNLSSIHFSQVPPNTEQLVCASLLNRQIPIDGLPQENESLVENCKVKSTMKESFVGNGEQSDFVQSFPLARKELSTGPNISQESSMTPDGLLPLRAVASDRADNEEQCLPGEGKEQLSQWSLNSNPRKRMRARMLESSDSDSNTEEDLPSLAELLGPKQPATNPQEDSNQWNPLQNRDLEASPSSTVESSVVLPVQQSVPASQGSVDLFSTQSDSPSHRIEQIDLVETEVPSHSSQGQMELPDRNRVEECGKQSSVEDEGDLEMKTGEPLGCLHGGSHTGELPQSSQSEILTTQQKDTIQKDLRRIEEEMAVLEAALKGQGSPEGGSSSRRLACLLGQGAEGEPGLLSVAKLGIGTTKQSGSSGACDASGPIPNPREGAGSLPLPAAGVLTSRTSPGAGEARGRLAARRVSADRGAARGRMVLVGSGLDRSELIMVQKFARKMDGTLAAQVTPGTTHVIMKTDPELVCERTLKYFLGIAGRMWVVSFLWIRECFRQGQLLDEAAFEVKGDVINGRNHQGPRRARTATREELLLSNYEICCHGSFTDMTTGQLEWMVELCGATVAKEPFLFTYNPELIQVVVVQPEAEESQTDYKALQRKYSARVVTREWVLDSVALYSCQALDSYLVKPLS
nr:PREDICTED: breast cancer type 1 susceptibility protein isoform X3 [Lepisosteus oculatus]